MIALSAGPVPAPATLRTTSHRSSGIRSSRTTPHRRIAARLWAPRVRSCDRPMADLLAGHVSRATILPRRAAPDDLCGLSLAGLLVHAQVHVHVPMKRQAYLRLRPDPERRVGRSRLVSANPASRYIRPLTEGLARVRSPVRHRRGVRGARRSRRSDLWVVGRPVRGHHGPRRMTSTFSSSATHREPICTRRPSGPRSASGCR